MASAVSIRAHLRALWARFAGLRPEAVSALERGEVQGMRFDSSARLCETIVFTPGELFGLADGGHRVPVLGGDDEDDIIRERPKCADGRLVDGPSFLAALLRERG